ncbi:MAG: type IIL restriction-modification enzyme MmeI, partial [Burkholderiaceae bacterium]
AGILDWFKQLHPESHGNADLVAHFFRRCFVLLRPGGTLGLIATNTIAQGDTRSTGLRWICTHNGTIYAARRRYRWPGVAAVVVSIVHLCKGAYDGEKLLDGRPVPQITAFLFDKGGHDDPKQLIANAGKSFQGSIVLGMGFTFDDSGEADDDTPGIPSPIATMERLIAEYPKNAEVIFPYIGGKEVNDSPTHAHHRYVINFGDRTEEECRRQWPELMAIVERKVKPERMENNRESYRRYWWQYAEKRGELYSTIAAKSRILACPGGTGASKHLSLSFLDVGQIYSQTTCVFALDHLCHLGLLSSQVHELWAVFNSATLEDRLRYNSSSCFETFPFPAALLSQSVKDQAQADQRQSIESIGEHYHQFRTELMIANNEGLTSTYNRFHDPSETSEGILELRSLHQQMDQAVLQAYGWDDIPTSCGFGLDYLDSDGDTTLPPDLQERIASGDLFFDTASEACAFQSQLRQYGAVKPSKKLPWRHRWPDAVRDDVLARLLALNAERYAEEQERGLKAKGAKARAGGGGARRGCPPKPAKAGETGSIQAEQMGLGL